MFHVSRCACCDTLAVCYHGKYEHGLSYCWKCIDGSRLWHSLSAEDRLDFRTDYERAVARKDFQRELAAT